MVLKHRNSYAWEGVPVHPYKEDGTHFLNITRQTLFKDDPGIGIEFRYFEVGPGGHSTLERHDHVHLVMVIRGSGRVLTGDAVTDIGMHDVVHISSQTWHQFRATNGEELGFLCVVSCERDRPERPDASQIEELSKNPAVADFIRY